VSCLTAGRCICACRRCENGHCGKHGAGCHIHCSRTLTNLRLEAARRCGLSAYPAELIALSETIDRSGNYGAWIALDDRQEYEYRRLRMAAELSAASP
jgi:hypothetical protein